MILPVNHSQKFVRAREEQTITVAQISANFTDEVKICYMKTTASFGKVFIKQFLHLRRLI